MESSGRVPDVFVTAPELAGLVSSPGPFASVYLTTEGEVHDAGERLERRWKNLRASLADQGAGDAVLEAIDEAVPDAYLRGAALAVVADASGVRHAEHHPDPPPNDVGRWAPLPALLPLIEWRQSCPPHVVVLADRQGADLVATRRQGPEVHREVDGDEYPLRKVGPGGWSQRRFQQRAENTWEQNADDVANELVKLVERVDAQLVVVAGDVRAVQLLQDALPPPLAGLVHVIEGGHSADGSGESIDAQVADLLRETIERQTAEVVAKFAEERGQHDRAVEGLEPILAALAMAQVAGLLLDENSLEGEAWCGPEPVHVAATADDLATMGVEVPLRAPLVDVLVRAALGTGAGVRIVAGDSGPADGVGALLRWA